MVYRRLHIYPSLSGHASFLPHLLQTSGNNMMYVSYIPFAAQPLRPRSNAYGEAIAGDMKAPAERREV
jgi:hypothetical protein